MAGVEFISNLGSVLKATKRQLNMAAEIIGGMAESRAKQYVTDAVYSTPSGWYVRTGNLRNRITHTRNDVGSSVEILVGTPVKYAPYVELGTGAHAEKDGRSTPWSYLGSDGNWHTTSGMPPRPFLRPAIENHIAEYKDVLKDVLSG